MKRLGIGIIIGLAIGIGGTAVASQSAGNPCASTCIVRAGGAVSVPAVDLSCAVVPGFSGVPAGFLCDRASTPETCRKGRIGSLSVQISNRTMQFQGPDYCKTGSNGKPVLKGPGPSSSPWSRSP